MAPYTFPDRLFRRELNGSTRYTSIKGIYGDRKWANDLDLINELDGHSGCVNALSWSRSGRLLASGSDDTYLNIHSYLPDDDCNPFSLTTSISTGHSANIFSVKFMPHSNDRTLVTCAGDHEIRIFDLEYSSNSSTNRANGAIMLNSTRFMSPADTNAKVYSCHTGRVKRIVTESSPHLFLSCSEDGEVRQWDLRQPSSNYPRPRRGFLDRLTPSHNVNVPPPLISYKRYGIDINTISCSPSQPHYIALGGAHLHAFLHDRRMMGRDLFDERAASPRPEQVREATQCVRRFAPQGQRRESRRGNGHITACKISDANPNTIIVSWSGDSIYSFDLIHHPDADDVESQNLQSHPQTSTKGTSRPSDNPRRRRRAAASPTPLEGVTRASPRPRTDQGTDTDDDHFLAVNYGNGQSELIPLRDESVVTDDQRKARSITQAVVRLARLMFGIQPSSLPKNDQHVTGLDFTPALETAVACLHDIDHAIRTWTYPVNSDGQATAWQMDARRVRDATRRFVQCAGMLARILGGQFPAETDPRIITKFVGITTAPNESRPQSQDDQHALFCLDFIKAINLWLGSGPGALVQGFTARPNTTASLRNPILPDSGVEAIDEILIPHLLERTRPDQPISNLSASRFEVDQNLTLFETEDEALCAFQRALRTPFADLFDRDESRDVEAHDRHSAIRFWGFDVARGLLKSARLARSEHNINAAFGGGSPGDVSSTTLQPEPNWPDYLESGAPVTASTTIDEDAAAGSGGSSPLAHASGRVDDAAGLAALVDMVASRVGYGAVPGNRHGQDEYAGIVEDNSSSSDWDSMPDEEMPPGRRLMTNTLASTAGRARVHRHTPCHAATRSYSGHVNTATVKDVNFFGLNDEYVVSGSDSGHFMIWDAATTELLNVLHADTEVVNVVQGHPYEPVLAVSGIENTIKIFGADGRARRDAWYGRGVAVDPDQDAEWPHRSGSPLPSASESETGFQVESGIESGVDDENDDEEENEADDKVEDEDDNEDNDDNNHSNDEAAHENSPRHDPDAQWRGLRQGQRLRSCRRAGEMQEILRRNEHARLRGNPDAFITRSALAMLTMRMRNAAAAAAGEDDVELGEVPGVPGGDCAAQ